jgi:MSHA biogenesis protein MshP
MSRERGFLMPLAAFLVVMMALFALTMSRNTGQSAISSTQEHISLQSFYAAESGAQMGMSQLFFRAGALDRACADDVCLNTLADPPANIPGFASCTVTLACTRNTNAADTVSFYQITSTANCGAGNITAQRLVQVSSLIRES